MPITANLCQGDGGGDGGDRSCGGMEHAGQLTPPHLTADTDFRSLAEEAPSLLLSPLSFIFF